MTKQRQELKDFANEMGLKVNRENGIYFLDIETSNGTCKARIFGGSVRECLKFLNGLYTYKKHVFQGGGNGQINNG